MNVMKVLTQRKYQDHVSFIFAYKVVSIDDWFTNRIVIDGCINAAYEFVKAFLKEYKYCKKIMSKYFNKNLILSEEEEHFLKKVTVVGFVKNLLIMMKKK